jgi:hypothetical protein
MISNYAVVTFQATLYRIVYGVPAYRQQVPWKPEAKHFQRSFGPELGLRSLAKLSKALNRSLDTHENRTYEGHARRIPPPILIVQFLYQLLDLENTNLDDWLRLYDLEPKAYM